MRLTHPRSKPSNPLPPKSSETKRKYGYSAPAHHDSRRGGDIDLYVELPAMGEDEMRRLESRFWIRLQRALGERKIDIVTHLQGAPLRPVDQQARATGICL